MSFPKKPARNAFGGFLRTFGFFAVLITGGMFGGMALADDVTTATSATISRAAQQSGARPAITSQRVGAANMVAPATRMPAMGGGVGGNFAGNASVNQTQPIGGGTKVINTNPTPNPNPNPNPNPDPTPNPPPKPDEPGNSDTCRAAYRDCMDQFCLMAESDGNRCACSDNINQSKSLIQSILDIQDQANNMFTADVERVRLGARADFVFGTSDDKKDNHKNRSSLREWLASGVGGDALDADNNIGNALYYMASDACQSRLDKCGPDADMEQMLYSRMVTNDCKDFSKYLNDQKKIANDNLATAKKTVRAARADMFDTVNRYTTPGQCLLAMRACIIDQGGCGVNFENCLDKKLLERRRSVCDSVLDQCVAVREETMNMWTAEAKDIIAKATADAELNKRHSCDAQTQLCLEDNCSTATQSMCLDNIQTAMGICPIMSECQKLIPTFQSSWRAKLGGLRSQFCQNEVRACLQQQCGANFTSLDCLGKTPQYIVNNMCPQERFSSCKNLNDYTFIVNSAMLGMDAAMTANCINYFSEKIGAICGNDMACLPQDQAIARATSMEQLNAIDPSANAQAQVDAFFNEHFKIDSTVAACQSATQPDGGRLGLGKTVFDTAMAIAEFQAINRNIRAWNAKQAQLQRSSDLATARQICSDMQYNAAFDGKKVSVNFDPALFNCHVCYMEKICAEGGESKTTAGLKSAAGMASAGAGIGTMVSPGMGTAIGAVIGGVGGFFAGQGAGGIKPFCQEVPVCDDRNVSTGAFTRSGDGGTGGLRAPDLGSSSRTTNTTRNDNTTRDPGTRDPGTRDPGTRDPGTDPNTPNHDPDNNSRFPRPGGPDSDYQDVITY